MLLPSNIKMALNSLRSTRWRSLLTMLGIIIGITSVVTTVSIGEGIKQQIGNQINRLGSDLITVRSGKAFNRDAEGNISSVNFFSTLASSTLTEADLQAVKATPNVRVAVPFSLITGVPQAYGQEYQAGYVIASTEGVPEILNQKIEYGAFYGVNDANREVAVIGRRVAEQLFKENVPIGKTLTVRGQNFIVHGIFEEFPESQFYPSTDLNNAIFVPYEIGKRISGGQPQISQVLAKPTDPSATDLVSKDIRSAVLRTHAGQEDFTVLKQEENLAVANTVLSLITNLITAVAAISLLVGGIGIMNIMFVSVTERTHEIGIRKAIGATNSQILSQFLTEALMLSIVGSIIGVILSMLANYLLRIFTDLTPVITLPIIGIAVGVSVLVGVFFGTAPALKAARADPIEALREQ